MICHTYEPWKCLRIMFVVKCSRVMSNMLILADNCHVCWNIMSLLSLCPDRSTTWEKIICGKVRILWLHPVLLMPFAKMHHSQMKTTNQSPEECLTECQSRLVHTLQVALLSASSLACFHGDGFWLALFYLKVAENIFVKRPWYIRALTVKCSH